MRLSGRVCTRPGGAVRSATLKNWLGGTKVFKDIQGNVLIGMAIALVPIMGALAFAIDYSELSRQKSAVMNALDAAGIATARKIIEGATEDQVRAYAQDFFEANLNGVSPSQTTLRQELPSTAEGITVLKLAADLTYDPVFFPVFKYLRGEDSQPIAYRLENTIQLKNSTEIALVLDNSASMERVGDGSGDKRIDVLKQAATYLAEQLSSGAPETRSMYLPAQIALVPFSSAVNIGPDKDGSIWMDMDGISPVHHEYIDWSKMTRKNNPNRWIQKRGRVYYKRGSGWKYINANGEEVSSEDTPATRFSLYRDMRVATGADLGGPTVPFASWTGCVEARPYPYNTNDAPADSRMPETMFVPMFGPDEPGNYWVDSDGDGTDDRDATDYYYDNNYWIDAFDDLSLEQRMFDARKYFMVRPAGLPELPDDRGPGRKCQTTPITPLQDLTKRTGLTTLTDAIDLMQPGGDTDIPQGIVWGWRVLSSNAPFTEGRSEIQKGNDKVLIVLTDGRNEYGDLDPDDSGEAELGSKYAAHGYAGMDYARGGKSRLFLGTSVPPHLYTNDNYSKALDEHMANVCSNAKDNNIIIFTIAMDLAGDDDAISALRDCASESRLRKNSDGSAAKLFYNAKSGELLEVFKSILDELGNLRLID